MKKTDLTTDENKVFERVTFKSMVNTNINYMRHILDMMDLNLHDTNPKHAVYFCQLWLDSNDILKDLIKLNDGILMLGKEDKIEKGE